MTDEIRDPAEIERQAISMGSLATGLDEAQVAAVIDAVAPMLRRAHTYRMIAATRASYEELPATGTPQQTVERICDSWERRADAN